MIIHEITFNSWDDYFFILILIDTLHPTKTPSNSPLPSYAFLFTKLKWVIPTFQKILKFRQHSFSQKTKPACLSLNLGSQPVSPLIQQTFGAIVLDALITYSGHSSGHIFGSPGNLRFLTVYEHPHLCSYFSGKAKCHSEAASYEQASP